MTIGEIRGDTRSSDYGLYGGMLGFMWISVSNRLESSLWESLHYKFSPTGLFIETFRFMDTTHFFFFL